MKIHMTKEEADKLIAAFRASEDCEEASDGSFTVDLYDEEPALSLEIYPDKDGLDMTAVAILAYSEEMKGWYISERIRDQEEMANIAKRLPELFA